MSHSRTILYRLKWRASRRVTLRSSFRHFRFLSFLSKSCNSIPMPRLSSKAKSQVYSNLEKYARSGMGMDKACESLLSQPRVPGAERKIYLGLLEGLEANESIGRSMARAGVVVTNLEKEVITAAETGGMLEKGFSLLSEYFKRIDKTTRRRA